MKTITSPERYLKVKRYLEKRSKRCWKKKPRDSVRKRVADKRIRVNGRFAGVRK